MPDPILWWDYEFVTPHGVRLEVSMQEARGDSLAVTDAGHWEFTLYELPNPDAPPVIRVVNAPAMAMVTVSERKMQVIPETPAEPGMCRHCKTRPAQPGKDVCKRHGG